MHTPKFIHGLEHSSAMSQMDKPTTWAQAASASNAASVPGSAAWAHAKQQREDELKTPSNHATQCMDAVKSGEPSSSLVQDAAAAAKETPKPARRGRPTYQAYAPFHPPAQFRGRFPLITPGQYGEWVDHEGLIAHVFDIPGRFLQTELLQPNLVPRFMHARNRQRLQLLHKYTEAVRTLPELQQVQQRVQQAAGSQCPLAASLLPAELDAFLFFWKSPRMLAMAPGTGVGFTMIQQERPVQLDATHEDKTSVDTTSASMSTSMSMPDSIEPTWVRFLRFAGSSQVCVFLRCPDGSWSRNKLDVQAKLGALCEQVSIIFKTRSKRQLLGVLTAFLDAGWAVLPQSNFAPHGVPLPPPPRFSEITEAMSIDKETPGPDDEQVMETAVPMENAEAPVAEEQARQVQPLRASEAPETAHDVLEPPPSVRGDL